MKRVDNLHMCMMVAMTVNGEYKHAESAKDIRTSRTGMVRGRVSKVDYMWRNDTSLGIIKSGEAMYLVGWSHA